MKQIPHLVAACLLAALSPAATISAQTKAGEAEAPAKVKIIVPADAVVEVDGVKTMTTGAVREYLTPGLKPGNRYEYSVKVTIVRAAKPISVEQTIKVEAGQETDLDLSNAPGFAAAAEKTDEPKKEGAKKEQTAKDEAPPKKEVKLDVIYVPTPQPVVDAMLKLADVTDKDVVYDLGCGDGRIVVTAVKKFKAKKGVGVELEPERVKLSKQNAAKAGVDKQVEIREGSIFDVKDVADASVVALYLLDELNVKLRPMLQKSLKPGSRIVSHAFKMGDWKPDKEISVMDENGISHNIYLWTIPEKK